jgi:hypothetical protein
MHSTENSPISRWRMEGIPRALLGTKSSVAASNLANSARSGFRRFDLRLSPFGYQLMPE